MCEALNVHYKRWSNEKVFNTVVLRWLSRIKTVQNTTSEILVELDTLKGRQAASAALQVAQFFLFVGYQVAQFFLFVGSPLTG